MEVRSVTSSSMVDVRLQVSQVGSLCFRYNKCTFQVKETRICITFKMREIPWKAGSASPNGTM